MIFASETTSWSTIAWAWIDRQRRVWSVDVTSLVHVHSMSAMQMPAPRRRHSTGSIFPSYSLSLSVCLVPHSARFQFPLNMFSPPDGASIANKARYYAPLMLSTAATAAHERWVRDFTPFWSTTKSGETADDSADAGTEVGFQMAIRSNDYRKVSGRHPERLSHGGGSIADKSQAISRLELDRRAYEQLNRHPHPKAVGWMP